ncbi:MAG: hypothetical protein Q8O30_07340 [Candidatus Omnitrophota bacterium]|nr:hypothetical protein [Candidatus Omnitrophota bacterium]
MKKRFPGLYVPFLVFLSLFIFISIGPAFCQQTESITITTYYPAPFGVYGNLRLFPTTTIPACNANNEGVMYYDDRLTVNQLMVCRETTPGTYGFVVAGSNWTHPAGTNDLYANDTNWNVGIGTDNPQAILDVNSNTSGFLPPRMTKGDRNAIAGPVNGMMMFNTTDGSMDYYNNGWKTFGGDFGGAYSCYLCEWISFYEGLGIDVSSWYVVNPYTGGMSCPAGYHSQQLMPPVLVGGSADIFNVIVCWK